MDADAGDGRNLQSRRREGGKRSLRQPGRDARDDPRVLPAGLSSPLHASGIGKALLATYEPDRTERLFRGKTFARFTDKTIGSLEQLREDIEATRHRGYAIDDEERTIGMRCVAAPILNFHGEAIAGISVSGPTHRLSDEKLKDIGERVRKGAATVSRLLGATTA